MTYFSEQPKRRFWRYVKIRYYGLLNNRKKKEKLKLCREALGVPASQNNEESRTESWEEMLLRLTGVDPTICPNCDKGRMVRRRILRYGVASYAAPSYI